MFENQPKGLFALALANTGERFGYYTMIAVFALFLRSNFGFDPKWAGEIYGDFLMLVYFLPIVAVGTPGRTNCRHRCDVGSFAAHQPGYRSIQG